MPIFPRFLKYFVCISRCTSMRKAVKEVNIAASAIDRPILQTEDRLGSRTGTAISTLSQINTYDESRDGSLAFTPLKVEKHPSLRLALCVNTSHPISNAAQLITVEIRRYFPPLDDKAT